MDSAHTALDRGWHLCAQERTRGLSHTPSATVMAMTPQHIKLRAATTEDDAFIVEMARHACVIEDRPLPDPEDDEVLEMLPLTGWRRSLPPITAGPASAPCCSTLSSLTLQQTTTRCAPTSTSAIQPNAYTNAKDSALPVRQRAARARTDQGLTTKHRNRFRVSCGREQPRQRSAAAVL